MYGINEIDPSKVQTLMDEGRKVMEIMRQTNAKHHSVIPRLIERYSLEYYKAYDEYYYKYDPSSSIAFEWCWEEDILEEISDQLFNYYYFNISENVDELFSVSRYVRGKYGDIIRYLIVHKKWVLIDYLKMTCVSCEEEKQIHDFYKDWSSGYFGRKRECTSCSIERVRNWVVENPERMRDVARNNSRRYYMNNPDKVKVYNYNAVARRRALDLSLGFDFDIKENIIIFGDKCVITGSFDINYDHFIPLIWGHGGSYNNNMYPLDSSLNSSKWAHNPFKWFEFNYIRYGLNVSRFNALVAKLAELNGLTTEEFVDYVNWCDTNRRTQDELERSDGRTSIELWKEATG